MINDQDKIILAIETSCDDTAVSVIEYQDQSKTDTQKIKILSHLVSSQTDIHADWGGVVPHLAKREHSRNLIPLLKQALKQAGITTKTETSKWPEEADGILEKNLDLLPPAKEFLTQTGQPNIDSIAVTAGPGLEPALWTGLNLAKILALAWQIPLIPVNHLLGHLTFPLLSGQRLDFPALALIVSGGHTELIKVNDWQNLHLYGRTRDDAAGEAFDKVARLLDLPYPGGPAISQLAEKNDPKTEPIFDLPRPMINSEDYDMSFSGLKTAVRYRRDSYPLTTDSEKISLAYEFQEAVIDVLVSKTKKALIDLNLKTLIVGGGVSANTALKQAMKNLAENFQPPLELHLPPHDLSTDNASMIGLAAIATKETGYPPTLEALNKIEANGHLPLTKNQKNQ